MFAFTVMTSFLETPDMELECFGFTWPMAKL